VRLFPLAKNANGIISLTPRAGTGTVTLYKSVLISALDSLQQFVPLISLTCSDHKLYTPSFGHYLNDRMSLKKHDEEKTL
jgi:hypothetical protein